jgi:hypothetical protein
MQALRERSLRAWVFGRLQSAASAGSADAMADLAIVYLEDGYVEEGETMIRHAEQAGAVDFQNRDHGYYRSVLMDELARQVADLEQPLGRFEFS